MSDSDIDRIIGRITRKLFLVLIPTIILTGGGVILRDHFLIKNKVDKIEYTESQASLILLVEKKTRALESLAKGNTKDITNLNRSVDKIEGYQREIDKYLRDKYRTRGDNVLPKY